MKKELIEVARNINGMEFDSILKLCKKMFPRRKYEAYSLRKDSEGVTRYVIKYNLTMEEYNALCEEWEKQGVRITSGTFAEGCGVIAYDTTTDKYYHLIVLKDKENGKLFIEINNKKYYTEDVIL